MLFPARCGGCRRRGWAVCPACAAALRPACPPRPPGLDGCASLVRFEGPARPLVAELKYRNNRAALAWWGARLAGLVAELAPAVPATITWAPTTEARCRERGFDQAELLARALAVELGVAQRRLLARLAGPPQTGRSRQARLHGPAFRYVGPAALGGPALGGPVLVVDDVLTTGATLAGAARTLRVAGFAPIYALTAAWTPL